MKKKLPTFVKLPTAWIGDGGLRAFTWKPNGSDHLAALMVLIVIAQHMDPDDGVARLTFTQLGDMASIGREKVSRALDKQLWFLEAHVQEGPRPVRDGDDAGRR